MLGRRKPTPATTAELDPDERLANAEQALGVLLGELDEVRQVLGAHQQQRQAIMSGDGDLQQIVELDRADYQLNLRHEQIQHQLPPLQAAVQQAHVAAHEARWEAFRPRLVDAELQLAAVIGNLYDELRRARDVHDAAHRSGFGGRLREFLTIPPSDPVSDYAIREYAKHAGQDRRPAPPAEDFTTSEPVELPPDPHFVPKQPDFAAIRAIGPWAPPRGVRILHGPTQTTNLNIGISRVHPGETHVMPAKAAALLVSSGVAEYLDSDEAVEALNAVA